MQFCRVNVRPPRDLLGTNKRSGALKMANGIMKISSLRLRCRCSTYRLLVKGNAGSMWHYVGSARESAESVSLPNGHFSFLAGLHCSVSLRPVESNHGPPTTREGWAGVIPANEARSLASAAAARDSVRYEQSERNLPFLSEMMWLLGGSSGTPAKTSWGVRLTFSRDRGFNCH